MLKRLVFNTGSNLSVMATVIVITFVLTPVLVSSLGNYDYGLWTMLAALMGYAGILDLGLRPTISRFVSRYHAQDDVAALGRLFSTAFTFLMLTGAIAGVAFASWGLLMPQTVAPLGAPEERYTLVLVILGAHLLAAFPGYVAEGVLEGLQRYYLKNAVSIVKMAISAVIILSFITPENALVLLASVTTAGKWVRNAVLFVIVARVGRGRFKLYRGNFSVSHLAELLRFGVKSFIQGISTRIETATDSLVIGFMLGPATVPFYSIPAALIQYVRTIALHTTHAFMPLFSDLNARGQQVRIQRIYLMASKLIVGFVLPLAAGAVLLGPPFLTVWVGPEIGEQSQTIVLLLALFLALPFLNPLCSRYLTAIDRHEIFARLQPISAALNLALSIAFVPWMGIVGAALASVLVVSAYFPIILVYTMRQLGVTVATYMLHAIAPAILPTALMAAAVGLYRAELALTGYPGILGGGILGAAVYLTCFWTLTLSPSERSLLRDLLLRPSGQGPNAAAATTRKGFDKASGHDANV